MLNMTEVQFKVAVDEVISKNEIVLELKSDVAVLKSDVSCLKSEQHRQGLILEDMQCNVRTIVQALSPLLRNSEKTQALVDGQHEQNERIDVTQEVLRTHIGDKNIHRTA